MAYSLKINNKGKILRTIPQSEIDYIKNNKHLSLITLKNELHRSKATIYKYLDRTTEENLEIKRLGRKKASVITSGKIQNAGNTLAEDIFSMYKSENLFLVGLALYWAEGRKTGATLSIANSDPKMIQIFYSWTKKYLPPKVSLAMRIQLPVGCNKDELIKYWSLLLPNVIVKTVYYGKYTKTLNGVCNLEIYGIKGARSFRNRLLYLYCTYLESIAV
jgi:hypothetical protein